MNLPMYHQLEELIVCLREVRCHVYIGKIKLISDY